MAVRRELPGNGDNGSRRWTARIGILGPQDVRDEAGQLVRLGSPRLRAPLIRLALGRGAELAPEAGELATAHPLRERLRGQLAPALPGRAAGDALAVCETPGGCSPSGSEWTPSPALSDVHLAILRADPSLGHPAGNGDAPAQPDLSQRQPCRTAVPPPAAAPPAASTPRSTKPGSANHGSASHGSASHGSAGHGSAGHGSAGDGSAGARLRRRRLRRPRLRRPRLRRRRLRRPRLRRPRLRRPRLRWRRSAYGSAGHGSAATAPPATGSAGHGSDTRAVPAAAPPSPDWPPYPPPRVWSGRPRAATNSCSLSGQCCVCGVFRVAVRVATQRGD